MNNELANFYIEFTTKGLAELKEGLDDINGKIDDLGSNMQGSAGKSDGLGSTLLGLATAFGLVSAAAAAATAAITTAFKTAEDSRALRNLSITTGESARNIETLGLMLERYGGDMNDAAQVYQAMNDIAYQMATWGNVTEDQQRLMSRYHEYGLELTPGMSADQILMALQRTFYNLRNSGQDEGWIASAINDIASGFGISSQPMIILLQQSIEDLIDEQERVRELLVLSNENVQRNSDELFENKQELRQLWKQITADLIPVLSDVLELLKPIVAALAPIAEWALKQVGGTLGFLSDTWDLITGDISFDEWLKRTKENESIFGSAARVGETIGQEIGQELIDPKVSDIFAGEPSDLIDIAYNQTHGLGTNWGLPSTSNIDNSTHTGNTVNLDLIMPDGRRIPGATVQSDGSVQTMTPNMLMGGVL